MKKKICLLLAASCAFAFLASCSSSAEEKWSYTREGMSDFMSLQANLEEGSDGNLIFRADTGVPLFKEEIDADDVIVYDVDKAGEILAEKKKGYADYATLKEASASVVKVETPAEKDGFSVSFSPIGSANYGMLIHSSVTEAGEYMMVSKRDEGVSFQSDPQAEFEEKYLDVKNSWEDGGRFAFQIISNLGMILVGGASDSPTAVASGVFGLLSSLAENFLSGGATIQGVMDQLKETDRKIDELSARLEKNTQQLANEIVRAEALVDQKNLNTLNLAINDFATNSLSKINDFNRDLADEVGKHYRSFVQSPQTIDLVLTQDEKGEWRSFSLMEIEDDANCNFTLSVSDFPNAKAHLSSHSNIVEDGFMAELDKDIDAAIEAKNDVPEGIDKANLRSFVASMIYERFMKQYFSSNESMAQKYRNLAIDYAERILGASGKVSVLSTYLSRLKCMYNFAAEIKPIARALSVNLLQTLDTNVARAAEACLFAGITSSEMEKDYKSAREAIQSFYTGVKGTSDAYSFTTSATLTGGFYQAKYTPSYSNPGNHCSLNVSFEADKVEMKDGGIAKSKEDMSQHASLSSTEHSRIATRWNLLRASGASESENDYIHYLSDATVLSSASLDAADSLLSWKQMGSSCYRILTDDRTERELNGSDSSTSLACVAKGNPGGDYFELNKAYNFRKTHTDSCWYGKTYEGVFVDASSGVSLGTQKIATWARYAEDHWYWSNDEYWAFVSADADSYFFTVDFAN